MDYLTKLTVLKENGNVTGLRIDPQGTTEDEYFCCMFPRELTNGRASITISGGEIIFKSLGIGGEEEFSFEVGADEEAQLNEILSGLGKKHQGKISMGGFGGCSMEISFCLNVLEGLNKRQFGKIRKSRSYRKVTPPKSEQRLEEWHGKFANLR